MFTPLANLRRPMVIPSYRALWASQLVSVLGDWAARLALLVVVLDRTHSALLTGVVTAASFIPWAGPGQYLATRLDHLPRKHVMIGADLIRALLFGLMVLPIPTAALITAVFVAACATPAFETARSSLQVAVVPEEIYVDTVAVTDMTITFGTICGLLFGGLGVAAIGATAALAVNAGTFVFSAGALTFVREPAREVVLRSPSAHLASALRVIRADQIIWRGLWTTNLLNATSLAVMTSAAVYARYVLHASAGMVGLLLVVVPAVDFIGCATISRSGNPVALMHRAGQIALVGALVSAIGFASGHLAGALIGFCGTGFVMVHLAFIQAAVGPRIPSSERSGVFSILQGSLYASQAIGATVGGIPAGIFGARSADLGAALFAGAIALALATLPIRVSNFSDDTDPGSEAAPGGLVDEAPA